MTTIFLYIILFLLLFNDKAWKIVLPAEKGSVIKMAKKSSFTTKDIVIIALAVTLITICSWISIPTIVPFTMQTFAIFTVIGLLGKRRAIISILVYIALGIVGLPVFSGFSGGIGRLLGSTGGYIIGFIFSAFVTGFIIEKFGKKIHVMIIAMVLGLIACYTFGTAWFIYVYTNTNEPIGVFAALSLCVFPFIIPDALKIALSILTINRVGKYIDV